MTTFCQILKNKNIMKHVKDIILEKRDIKSYTKYVDLINYKINDIFSSETEFYSASHIEY